MVIPLRPSSEHLLIVRAPGAEDHTGFPNLFFSLLGGGLVEFPTARNFLTRPPTGTPRRAISPSEGLLILYTAIQGSGQGCPLLRASRDHFPKWGLCERRGPPIMLAPSPPLTALSTGSYNLLTFLPATG